ncbi:MAG: bifunctional glutamate N-acetyltransferase/amino-acid acetyltransferase ArgJ [Flavobacteriaceae bacterium]
MKVSPLAPKDTPRLKPIAGVRLAAVECNIRYKGRPDLMLMALDEGSVIAGALTRSTTAGPPVEWCRDRLSGGSVRGIVVNSGNANAFTGDPGRAIVRATAERAAAKLGCEADDVFISSTGVIGEPPPLARLEAGVDAAAAALSDDAWADAARAIMTTDTFAKLSTRSAEIEGTRVTVNGIAKGSGMIAPDMATMLVYLATDAAIAPKALQAMTTAAVDLSFNCITVDSDTSTSDTLLVAATGKAGNRRIEDAGDPAAAAFAQALREVCLELAHLVVRDGEGATKFVEIAVTGAQSDADAHRMAMTVANSPLVKTAIAGSDPNWGRLVAAIGKSGIEHDQRELAIRIGGLPVAEKGAVVPGYDEAPVAAHMKNDDIRFEISVGSGRGAATVWTCDLTHGYIDINVSYRS